MVSYFHNVSAKTYMKGSIKMKLKRMAAAFAAALMTLLCICTPVGANEFEEHATEFPAGKTLSFNVKDGHQKVFKIQLTESGTLEFTMKMGSDYGYLNIYDQDGEKIEKHSDSGNDANVVKLSGKVELKKGTYYVSCVRTTIFGTLGGATKGTGKTTLTLKFPSSAKATASKSSYPAVYLSAGESVRLGMIAGGKAADSVTLSSSKASVAKVDSDGIVTAKAKGTMVVTVKSGSASVKVAVIVE